ncbi:P-loop NTPase [Microbacterium esteraromaticum]|uniref:P-loop NTPase n=1 Tax=Microbacterium esteraromaticum TaxID=57043 RepID=A0A939DVG2_9MICO|nr:P-loop NTPase [Microbacterium esteraromaticum]MBN8205739.1 P-loop NTPase [Microbacterium esteraromaticum]MBN8415893.1 P-loop NTPase [Microbacterium esteraromaticum]MBN8423768.1 P-loop NTPase [Microbacterium esteraromaticum]
MTSVLIAIAHDDARMLASDLELEGCDVRAVSPDELSAVSLASFDALLLTPSRTLLTADLVGACDRAGVRLVPIGPADSRLAARFGLPAPLPYDTPAAHIVATLSAPPDTASADSTPHRPPRVIAVWGPHGAPGRTTVAIQLAVELARAGRRTALVDADSVAPSVALQLGLGDESPGLAAACRRAELGSLDVAELTRLASMVETSAGTIDVLSGLNRPSRWPELAAGRLRTTLSVCRTWADDTVVDVSAEFDEDDDPLDPGAPARHAATAAALLDADEVVAVLSADPLGVSRFIRGHAELRHLIGGTPVTVVANRVRPGPLGIDARGQVRRTLERFAGIDEVAFVPHDARAADAAALHARAIADVAPRSQLVAAVRRVANALDARAPVTAGSSPRSSRAARQPH